MPSASALRRQIEAALADRIPSALTPVPRVLRPVASSGIPAVDELLGGGLPLGCITEIVGPECSGRTSFAMSFLSRITQEGKTCAWVDASDAFHPESAAAAGIHLPGLLWVRCGVLASMDKAPAMTKSFAFPEKYLIPSPTLKGLHGAGCGGHPRNEVKGLSDAVSLFLRSSATGPVCVTQESKPDAQRTASEVIPATQLGNSRKSVVSAKPWSRIEQALRVTDLLLQAGGFGAIVLDMGSIAPDFALRIPLATWFRYRAAAEKTQANIVLISQQPCAKTSAGLLMRFQPVQAMSDERTVFTGNHYRVEVERERFKAAPADVILLRKPPQRVTSATWQSRTTWAGAR